MKKRLLTITMTVVLAILFNITAFADAFNYTKLTENDIKNLSDQQLQQLQNQWEINYQNANDAANKLGNNAQVQAKIKQRDELNSEIEGLDEKINALIAEIKKNDSEIQSLGVGITYTQKDANETQNEVNKQQHLMDERIKAIYKRGTGGYLCIILKASSFMDFINRVKAVEKMLDYDRQIKSQLESKKSEYNKQEKLLKDNQTQIESIKKDNQEKKAALEKIKQEETIVLNNLNQTINNYLSAANAAEIAGSNLTLITVEERLRHGETTTVSQQAIIDYAERFLGTPYVWGGTTPAGFDCSGFTQYVYAHFGISIPRVAADQARAGLPVDKSSLQPGDLVFFWNATDGIHHVGMYIGGGQYIHSPHTGDHIKISALGDFYCARRFLF